MDLNSKIVSMFCIRCSKELAIDDYYLGCPKCLKENEVSNVSFVYNNENFFCDRSQIGMKKYCDWLPYDDFPYLGEGDTPLVEVAMAELETALSVFLKCEHQNPSGSHKDRMNPLIVKRAKELGMAGVIAASSGNEGVSLALYAASAGLKCEIVSTKTINSIWKNAILATGAQLVLTETPDDRLVYIKERIKTGQTYSATNILEIPSGSSSFGIQGYKTISYEIIEQMNGEIPDYVFMPVSRGDLLYGIYEGFVDLKNMKIIATIPKLVAVEPFERLSSVLRGSDYKQRFIGDSRLTSSIGGATVTYQARQALQKSDGFAIELAQYEIMNAVYEMARKGFYLETSAAILYGALKKSCVEKALESGSKVVLVSTSHGFKNDLNYYQSLES